jgi:CHAT domain-containing protein
LQDAGPRERRHDQVERRLLSAIIAGALGFATIICGCPSSPASDPAAVERDIRADITHGDLALAQKKAERWLKYYSGHDAKLAMEFRLLDAEILSLEGRSQDSLALLTDTNFPYPTAGDLAIKRKMLCSLAHVHLGQPQLADQELQEARQLSESSHSPLLAEVLQTEGIIEERRDHRAAAANSFRASLAIARAQNNRFLQASNLLNLGWLALHAEHNDEALDWFRASSEIARSIQARVLLESDLGNIGWAYYKLGDYEKALMNFREAEEQARNLGAPVSQINWLNNAGLSLYQLGDLKGADEYYRKALAAAQAIDSKELIANTRASIALLFLQQGQIDSARLETDEALKAARLLQDKSVELDPLFLQAVLAARQANAAEAERMLLHVHQESADAPSLQWGIENSIGDFYVRQHQPQKAETWYRKSIQTFETQRSSVKDEELKLPFFANGDSLYRDYADFLIASQKPTRALQLLDLGRARTLAEGLGTARSSAPGSGKPGDIPSAGLQSADPASADSAAVDPQAAARRLHAVILFYSLGPDKSSLWVVTGKSTRLFALPKQSEINDRVQRYQKAILRSNDPLREASEDGRSLYDLLVAPAAAMLPQGSRVFVIPDGTLNGLNFETLLVPGDDRLHYWIENVTVTSANSIRMLSRLDGSSNRSGTNRLLLIGNPISPSAEYENLPNGPVEIGDVAGHFAPDQRTVLTQAQAVPAAYVVSKPDQFAYIHFVAHGTASRLSPLDSAVVLSAEPQHPDNFKLYARDIIRHRLHAKLVTISTCYGSGQRAYAGEGLVGLSWAFLRAGSHNVIAALWAANDASTPLLMDTLYTGLNAGDDPETALRAAKLSLIHSQGVYRKPLYWAAFQLYAGS